MEGREYVPQVLSVSNAGRLERVGTFGATKSFPAVKTDRVFRVAKQSTWRKIDVCPCFKDESFFPQVTTLFACLNQHYGDRGMCRAEQTAVDEAIMADIRSKREKDVNV